MLHFTAKSIKQFSNETKKKQCEMDSPNEEFHDNAKATHNLFKNSSSIQYAIRKHNIDAENAIQFRATLCVQCETVCLIVNLFSR